MGVAPPEVLSQEVVLFSAALNPAERAILSELLTEQRSIEEIVPADIGAGKLWEYMQVACKAMMRVRELMAKLKPLIGRLMLVVKEYPELYVGKDGMDPATGEVKVMETFEDFVAYGLPAVIGISRAEAYAAQKFAICFPEMVLETYAAIGNMKMKALTQLPFGPNGEPPKDIALWVDRAMDPRVGVDELRLMVANRTLANPGDLEIVIVPVTMTKAERILWREFKMDKGCQMYCGTSAEGTMLARAIVESIGEWRGQINDQRPDSGL
jgi:hypothetical protein